MNRRYLEYPDNLWTEMYGAPVPEDAEETLGAIFREAQLSDDVYEVVDVRYKQAKTLAETSAILGKSKGYVEYRLEKVRRAFRDISYNATKRGAPIEFGLAASKRIAEGKASWCSVCHKLIDENDLCFVVPDSLTGWIASWGHFVGKEKLCCSEECVAELSKAVAENCREKKERLRSEIDGLKNEIESLEETAKRYEDYKATPLSLKAALEELERLGEE